ELMYFLAWRDVLVRYKQTVVGVAWAVIRPLITTIIFTVIFGRIAKLPSPGDVPYALLVFTGTMPWNFFSAAMTESGSSLVANSGMISKVYFPRLVIPASSVATSFVDLCISAVLLAVMMLIYGYAPGPEIIALPFFVIVAAAAAFGAGLWCSALMVKYRDVRYIIPFVVQVGFFISPVGLSTSAVPEQWRFLYSLNPMVGVINGFRWSLLNGVQEIYWPAFAISIVFVSLLIFTGIWYFRKTERGFADII
ncbi:MAG: ABC transporter permease, partial [Opitutaceae bacterium]